MARITVILQVSKYPSSRDKTICLPLPRDLLYEALEQLDLPDINAHGFAQMLCTSALKIELVRETRENMAKSLSETITQALIKAMEADDTLMGYKIAGQQVGMT